MRLGERLVQDGLVSENELRTGLLEQRRTGSPLGEVLVSMGFVSEDVLAEILARDLGIPFLKISELTPDPALLEPMTAEFARQHVFFPIERKQDVVVVAMGRPVDILAIDAIKQRLWRQIEVVAASPRQIHGCIQKYLEARDDADDPLHKSASEIGTTETLVADIVELTDSIIEQGLKWGATDIHIEPEEKLLRIRYRIDGVLEQGENQPVDVTLGVVARVKILAGLDITERRKPQDGRMTITRDGNDIDMRVSLMPTNHGENIVLRVLDASGVVLELDQMGIGGKNKELILEMMNQPDGMLLVSGPTGSGKSTTMYALLLSVDSLTRKVATVEDPIEYQQPLIRQSQVNPAAGYTFADGLRSLLRQDPDVILVGEIRDGETAGIALKASLTGHFVISSIHTNSAVGVVTRLIDLGAAPYLVSSSMTGAVAQRLARRICRHCRTERPCDKHEAAVLGVELGTPVYQGEGCMACRDTGYAGRVAIVEVFALDDECARILAKGGRETELLDYSRARGDAFLIDDAREKCLNGMTTVKELLRVCPPTVGAED